MPLPWICISKADAGVPNQDDFVLARHSLAHDGHIVTPASFTIESHSKGVWTDLRGLDLPPTIPYLWVTVENEALVRDSWLKSGYGSFSQGGTQPDGIVAPLAAYDGRQALYGVFDGHGQAGAV